MNIFYNIIKRFRTSIFAEYLPMFLIILILLLGVFYLAEKTSQKVVWHGMPSKISMSGDFRFYQTNQKGQWIDDVWFWAVPADIYDTENIERIYKILDTSGIYKITGIRNEDDCDYYNDTELEGTCIPDLTLIDISRTGTRFLCPERYAAREYYFNDIMSFISYEEIINPNIDIETLTNKRLGVIIENGCRQTEFDLFLWSEDIKEAYDFLRQLDSQ